MSPSRGNSRVLVRADYRPILRRGRARNHRSAIFFQRDCELHWTQRLFGEQGPSDCLRRHHRSAHFERAGSEH